jgi:hypothetical protein
VRRFASFPSAAGLCAAGVASLAACLGCSFPSYVADLEDGTVNGDSTIGGGDSAGVDGADACASPCGCAPADTGVDAHGVDATTDTHAGDVSADVIASDAKSDAPADAPSDAPTFDAGVDVGVDAGSDAVVAVDGSIGESCGPCGTGKKICVGTTLACSTPDDRKTLNDSSYPHTTVTRDLTRRDELAIGYPIHKSGTPYSLQLTLSRTTYVCAISTTPTNPDPACDKCVLDPITGLYTCKVTKPVDGNLTVKLMKGQPTDPAPAELSKVVVPATSIALGSGLGATATTFVFPIDASVAPLAASTTIYVDLTTDSSAWAFVLAGDRPRTTPAPPDVVMWSRTIYPPAATWTVETSGLLTKSVLPDYEIDLRGCF